MDMLDTARGLIGFPADAFNGVTWESGRLTGCRVGKVDGKDQLFLAVEIAGEVEWFSPAEVRVYPFTSGTMDQ